jgi:hypothetical protein
MKKLDQIFDAAGKVLEATIRDQELAEEAIKNLNGAITNLGRSNQELRRQIQQEVKNSLESSVSSAVDGLIKKFQIADKYADQAARRYEQAVHDANQRVSDRVRNIILIFLVGLAVGVLNHSTRDSDTRCLGHSDIHVYVCCQCTNVVWLDLDFQCSARNCGK